MGQGFRENLRVLRLVSRHDRRALKEEAERNPSGLARWAHATESWMHGEIAAARQSAEMDLQARPDDFDLIRICLDYYIRSRDSAQIYAHAKRLLAAKNPAAALRRFHAVQSIILWPVRLLGHRRRNGFKIAADNCDKWVAWSRDYVAKHSAPLSSTESADAIPFQAGAIAVTARTLARHAWNRMSMDVSVNGTHILTTGALKTVSGSYKQTFVYEGQSHQAVLMWGRRSFRFIPYTLEIDRSFVETSRVYVFNWWGRYWPLAAFAAGLALGALVHWLQN